MRSSPAYRYPSDLLVARLAAGEEGVLSIAELLACGLTRNGVARRAASGRLHRIHLGVYAVGHPGLTREGRWLAAVKACGPGAALGDRSALMHLGALDAVERLPDVTVTRPRRVAGVRTRLARGLDPRDVRRVRGIPTVSPELAILQMAATASDVAVRRAMSRAQALRLTSLRALAALLDRTPPTTPGRRRYARVLAAEPPGTRSELEDRVHDLVLAAGFAAPDVNVALVLDGIRTIPDLRWPRQRLVVEADGAQWHADPQARAQDAERQARLEAHGERVLRVTWEQATAHAAQTVARLDAAGAPR